MTDSKMAVYIAELRKANKMTQKELATKLNVTDKAVSKWERGLSCPDVSLLNPLSRILGVTTSELLNGESNSISVVPDAEEVVESTLKYVDTANKSKFRRIRTIAGYLLTVLFFIGIVVCVICDMAITGTLTWSLYPIASIIFAWSVFFPAIQLEKNGVIISLIIFSALVIPFLYILKWIIGDVELLTSMGNWIALISIIYLWAAFVLFKGMGKKRLTAAAISVLFAIPVSVLITFVISKFIDEAIIDVWDILVYSILIVSAFILFSIEKLRTKT